MDDASPVPPYIDPLDHCSIILFALALRGRSQKVERIVPVDTPQFGKTGGAEPQAALLTIKESKQWLTR
jgi:hypothetical protein